MSHSDIYAIILVTVQYLKNNRSFTFLCFILSFFSLENNEMARKLITQFDLEDNI